MVGRPMFASLPHSPRGLCGRSISTSTERRTEVPVFDKCWSSNHRYGTIVPRDNAWRCRQMAHFQCLPNQRRADLRRRFAQMLLAVISAPRPEKAFQSVTLAARHDVDMQVGHALAHIIVDRDERAIGVERSFDSPLQTLRNLKQRPHLGRRQIRQRSDVLRGNQQNMAGE